MAQGMTLEEFRQYAASQGIVSETKNKTVETKTVLSNDIRTQDEMNENKMNAFLEQRYFPLLIKAGMISDFRRGEAQEDINGADYIFTFKDGSELNVDVKTRWSMMNVENTYVPVEIRSRDRAQIKQFEKTGIEEDSPGWMMDMDKNFNTEHNKNTDVILSVHPTRVNAATAAEARTRDIMDIKTIFFRPDEYFKEIERKTGLTSADINEMAKETNRIYDETKAETEKEKRTYSKGLENVDVVLYTSKGKLKEAPVVALSGESWLRSNVHAFQVNYYTNDKAKEGEPPFRLTSLGKNQNRLFEMAQEVKAEKDINKDRKENVITGLNELKQTKDIQFNSKSTSTKAIAR